MDTVVDTVVDQSDAGESSFLASQSQEEVGAKQVRQDEEAKEEDEDEEEDDMEFTCLKKLGAGERLQLKNATNTLATR